MSKDKTASTKPDFNRPAPDPLDDVDDDEDTLLEDEQDIIDDIAENFGEDLPSG